MVVTPLNSSSCRHLTQNSGVIAQLNISESIHPIEQEIQDFSYPEMTEFCFHCPEDDFFNCVKAFASCRVANFGIWTHSAYTLVRAESMHTTVEDYTACYTAPATVTLDTEAHSLCVQLRPTGRCRSLRGIDFTAFYLSLLFADSQYSYSLDKKEWRPLRTEYCHFFSSLTDPTPGNIDPQATYAQAEQAVLDLDAYGRVRIDAVSHGSPIRVEAPAIFITNDQQDDCFSSTLVEVYEFRVGLKLIPNPERAGKGDCRADASVVSSDFTIGIYESGWTFPYRLASVVHDFDPTEEKTIDFYPATEQEREDLLALTTTTASLFSEFNVAHRGKAGSIVSFTRQKVGETVVGCFGDMDGYFYADKVCYILYPLRSPNCELPDDLQGPANFTTMIRLPKSEEEQDLEDEAHNDFVLLIEASGTYVRDTATYCFPCSQAVNATVAECRANLASASSNKEKVLATMRFELPEQDISINWLHMTAAYRENYNPVFLVGGCVSAGLCVPFIIYALYQIKVIGTERKRLRKALRRAKRRKG